jgi:hypothetical protein
MVIENKGKYNETRRLQVGDIITCKGIKCEIAEIISQDYSKMDGFCTEFIDTKGNYRSWKQWSDGGTVKGK